MIVICAAGLEYSNISNAMRVKARDAVSVIEPAMLYV